MNTKNTKGVRPLGKDFTADSFTGLRAVVPTKPNLNISFAELANIVDSQDNNQFTDASQQSEMLHEYVQLIDIEKIDPPSIRQRWHYDPRDIAKMADSLLQEGEGDALNGQRQPVLLMSKEDGRFEMMEGMTRLLAFRNHHLGKHIKAIVSSSLNQRTAYRIGFVSNEGRHQLTDYDKGMSFKALLDAGVYKNQVELCEDLSLNKTTVNMLLCFAKLPESTHAIIEKDKSRFGYNTARLLAVLFERSSESHLNAIAEKILGGWSIAQLNAHIVRHTGEKKKRIKQQKRVSILGNLGQMECSSKRLALDIDVSQLPQECTEKLWIEIDKLVRDTLSKDGALEQKIAAQQDEISENAE